MAALAGLSVTWYTMLENASADGATIATLNAIGQALRLTDDELRFLQELASDAPIASPHQQPSELLSRALATVTDAPAYIATSQWDVLAWNEAMTLVWGIEAPGSPPFNIVRRMFGDLKPLHGDRFPTFAAALVGMVRAGTGSRLDDPVYLAIHNELIGDPVFAEAWATYDLRAPVSTIKTVIDSPTVGTFAYEALTLIVPDDSGHSLVLQVPQAACTNALRRADRR